MYAKVNAPSSLRLREAPEGEEIARIPAGTVVKVRDWDADVKWANVSYRDRWGYSLREYLVPISDDEAAKVRAASTDTLNAERLSDTFTFSTASGYDRPYIVIQVTLKEKWFGSGSRNLTDLEDAINHYAARGYRLHTMSTSESSTKGGLGGDRVQATLVFEKI